MIDKLHVKETFKNYVNDYNPSDPKIALKIAHTYRVAELCNEIAESLKMTEEQCELAWLLGMLHDIGRFEQVRIYNTFVDGDSVDHAEFGANLLFGKKHMILRFIDTRNYDELIEKAIRNHNKLHIASEIEGVELAFCQILRDADKIDILRVNIDTPMEDIYNTTRKILLTSSVSPEVMEQVRLRQCVTRDARKTPVDHLIGHMALNFELVFPRSKKIVLEQGYLDKLFQFPTENPETKKYIEETKVLVTEFLSNE